MSAISAGKINIHNLVEQSLDSRFNKALIKDGLKPDFGLLMHGRSLPLQNPLGVHKRGSPYNTLLEYSIKSDLSWKCKNECDISVQF